MNEIMTIQFKKTNFIREDSKLEQNIRQLIKVMKRLPTFQKVLKNAGRQGDIFIQVIQDGILVAGADWNAQTRVVRLEDNNAFAINIILQLCKAGNTHFQYIKGPNEFFTSNEYADYMESLNYITNLDFCAVISELLEDDKVVNACATIGIEQTIFENTLMGHSEKNNASYLGRMNERWNELDFSHSDIYRAQWDKFKLLEKIDTVTKIFDAALQDKDGLSLVTEDVKNLSVALNKLLYELEARSFLKSYHIETEMEGELLQEADSLQAAIHIQETYQRVMGCLSNVAAAFSLDLSELSDMVDDRLKLITMLEQAPPEEYFSFSSQCHQRCVMTYQRLKSTIPNPTKHMLEINGFKFHSPEQIELHSDDYRSEFINLLDRSDDLLFEFQVSYFDDILGKYGGNCRQVAAGNFDFQKDLDGDVIDFDFVSMQLLPKENIPGFTF